MIIPIDPFGLYNFVVFDRKNIRAQPESDDDKRQGRERQSYLLQHRIMLVPLINELFTKGIEQKILTTEGLIEELSKSWIGIELEETASDGSKYSFIWLELLAPAIKILFHEINTALENTATSRSLFQLLISSS